jgi:hypothetical protein
MPGADDVVVDALDHVVFDDRHMLVGRRVVERLHAKGRDRTAHPVTVMHGTEQRHDLDIQPVCLTQGLQFLIDLIEVVLAEIEQHQPARAQFDDLPAQLRADRATGTGDHHRLAADAGVEQIEVRRHGFAAQQVGHIDIADVIEAGLAGQQIADIRHRLQTYRLVAEAVDDLLAPTTTG